jgi:uroporphyrinogen decarboxylase
MKKIVDELRGSEVPVVLFSKGGLELLGLLKGSGADMLGVDWMTDLQAARNLVGDEAALQGNMDPTALYGSRDLIKKEAEKALGAFGNDSGHVFNLGHGILPDIPVDNVQYLVDTVREISLKMHT